jgi:hypothetical protein
MQNDSNKSLYDRCHELFEISKDFQLIRKIKRASNADVGSNAGWYDNGYYRLKIDQKPYLVHRIIYLMLTGEYPECVDHIDGDSMNNNINNLRPATKKQNRWNCRSNNGSQTGVKGVYVDGKKYKALVSANGERYYLGMYDTIEQAKVVVDKKYIELQSEYSMQLSRDNT